LALQGMVGAMAPIQHGGQGYIWLPMCNEKSSFLYKANEIQWTQ